MSQVLCIEVCTGQKRTYSDHADLVVFVEIMSHLEFCITCDLMNMVLGTVYYC